jgi:quercetin dioxygenase-like cupin family protein
MSDNSIAKLLLDAKDVVKEDFDWGQVTWYANRQLGNSEEMTLGRCVIKPGCANPRHYHPNCEEALQVVEGEIEHTLGDEAFTMRPGDTIVIPANLIHNARNIGPGEAVMTIVFSTADRQTVGEI